MEELCKTIINDEKVIFFLSGAKRNEFVEVFNKSFNDVMRINKDDPYLCESWSKKHLDITVKHLLIKYFAIDLCDFNSAPRRDILSFLDSSKDRLIYGLLNVPFPFSKNKLFVLVDNPDHIHLDDGVMRILSRIIHVDNKTRRENPDSFARFRAEFANDGPALNRCFCGAPGSLCGENEDGKVYLCDKHK